MKMGNPAKSQALERYGERRVADARVKAGLTGLVSPKLFDALLLTSWVVVLCWVLWLVDATWMIANVLLLTAPLTYILARSARVRAMIRWSFVVKYVLFVTVFFDYLCVRYGAWSGPTLFPKGPGGVNLEQITWTFLIIGLTLAVNEHFFSRQTISPPSSFTRPILSGLFFAGFVVALVPLLRGWLATYTYLKIGLALYPVVFVLVLIVNRPAMREVILTGVVMGAFNLAFELLALHNGFWTFPGVYVGMVEVFGYPFPTEELVFLVCLCSPAVVAAYALYKNWKPVLPPEAVAAR